MEGAKRSRAKNSAKSAERRAEESRTEESRTRVTEQSHGTRQQPFGALASSEPAGELERAELKRNSLEWHFRALPLTELKFIHIHTPNYHVMYLGHSDKVQPGTRKKDI